ncbi:MAG: hypothetical protein MJB14_13265 [Spirochaetes bacterium]|nr:hypothetical protein [Spirochaetota bacterium]
MKIKLILSSLFLGFPFLVIFAHNQISMEIIYNQDKTKILGAKKYLFNEDDQVNQVVLESSGHDAVYYKYDYQAGLLVHIEEYLGKNTLLKYSKLIYDKQKLIKRLDYTRDGVLVVIQEYYYHTDLLDQIVKKDQNHQIFEKVDFVYEKGLLKEEIVRNQKNAVIMKKTYLYKGEVISEILYQVQKKTIRRIERQYSSQECLVSPFGLPLSYQDLR